MPNTLLSIITHYAANNTKHTTQSISERFAVHPDSYINYILYSALPPPYSFDGIRHTFSRDEENQTLKLVCTFWYLANGGKSHSAALRFEAEAINDQIRYRYSVVPESEFQSYNKLWSEIYLLNGGNPSRTEWPEWALGTISPN